MINMSVFISAMLHIPIKSYIYHAISIQFIIGEGKAGWADAPETMCIIKYTPWGRKKSR